MIKNTNTWCALLRVNVIGKKLELFDNYKKTDKTNDKTRLETLTLTKLHTKLNQKHKIIQEKNTQIWTKMYFNKKFRVLVHIHHTSQRNNKNWKQITLQQLKWDELNLRTWTWRTTYGNLRNIKNNKNNRWKLENKLRKLKITVTTYKKTKNIWKKTKIWCDIVKNTKKQPYFFFFEIKAYLDCSLALTYLIQSFLSV